MYTPRTTIRRRAALKGLASGAGAAILAACGASGPPDATRPAGATASAIGTAAPPPTGTPTAAFALDPGTKMTIEYWHTSDAKAAIESIVQQFNARYPNVAVTQQIEPDYLRLTQKAQAAFAARIPPAVSMMGYTFLNYVAANFPHLPIDDAARRDAREPGTAWLADNFAPNILDLGRADGVVRAMPYSISVPVLYYNQDLLRQGGLDRPPRTWAEVREYARLLTRGDVLGFSMAEGVQFWQYQALVESNGARMLVGGAGEPRAGIDSPEAIEAMQFFADMVTKDRTATYAEDKVANPAFLSGRLAMMTNSTGRVGQLTRDAKIAWATAPFPTFGTKPRRVPAGGNLLFIFATEPQQQAAAWEFIKHLNAPAPLTQWDRAVGYLPTRRGIADDPRYLKPHLDATPALRPAVDQLADIVPWVSWPGKNGLQATQVLVDTLGRIYNGGQDAATVLRDSAQQINVLIRA